MQFRDSLVFGLEGVDDVEFLVKLWIHEATRVWRDCLPNVADHTEFDGMLYGALDECGPFTLPPNDLPTENATTSTASNNGSNGASSETEPAEAEESAAVVQYLDIDAIRSNPIVMTAVPLEADQSTTEPSTDSKEMHVVGKLSTVNALSDLAPRFRAHLEQYNQTNPGLDLEVVDSFIMAAVCALRALWLPQSSLVVTGPGMLTMFHDHG